MAELITIPATDLKKGMYVSILGQRREVVKLDRTELRVFAFIIDDAGWLMPIVYERSGDVEVVATTDGF